MVREFKGWHALVILLGFFGVTIGVNTVFVSYALSTFAGEDVSQPYLKGLAYNKKLAAVQAQNALGWSATMTAGRDASSKSLVIDVIVLDGAKRPVASLALRAVLRHPVNAHYDREATFEEVGAGHYRARVADLRSGAWDIVARTDDNKSTPFEASRRFMLP
jgi:nitrogen fixation protein FixH